MKQAQGDTVNQHSLDDLLQLMAALRDPQAGCPWDKKQTLQSLVPFTLEEAYEVAAAIDHGEPEALSQELGDLLFQVVFYAQLSAEQGNFDFNDVVSRIVSKLLRRHPHVFPDGTLASAGSATGEVDEAAVSKKWEQIKREERGEKQIHGVLDDIPSALPAIVRAYKMQSRASSQGFDWPQIDGVFAKLEEEIAELRGAIVEHNQAEIQEEMGDLLFTCVNLSRWLEVQPEEALRSANNKFETRFRHVEAAVGDLDNEMDALGIEQLEQLWQQAKDRENRG